MKNATVEALAEALQDGREVVNTATSNGLVTTKRLVIAGVLAVAVASTIVIVKKVRKAKAEAEGI